MYRTPDPNEEEPFITGSHGRLEWQLGPPLPEPRARACAVAVDDHTIIVVGAIDIKLYFLRAGLTFPISGGHDGNTSSVKSLNTGLKLNVGTGQWSPIANMEVPRFEHTMKKCTFKIIKQFLKLCIF